MGTHEPESSGDRWRHRAASIRAGGRARRGLLVVDGVGHSQLCPLLGKWRTRPANRGQMGQGDDEALWGKGLADARATQGGLKMISKIVYAAACAAACVGVAAASQASGIRVITKSSGGYRHLSAAAEVVGNSVRVRVSHRGPGGFMREPGAHLHVRVGSGASGTSVVRGIPPRSPRSRVRQAGDRIMITMPVEAGTAVRDVHVACIPRPHAECRD